MRAKIESIEDLRNEINRLQNQRKVLEGEFQITANIIREKLNAPVILYNKIKDFVAKFIGIQDKPGVKDEADWVTNLTRIGLPVMLNKYLFSKSGFLIKSLVTMLSARAAGNINKDLITDLVDKVSSFFGQARPKRRKEPVLADYGIPPDSETS